MEPTVLEKDLLSFWGIALAIFSFLLGTNMRQAVEQDLTNPKRLNGISDLILLFVLFIWFLLYLYGTYFEAKGMGLIFTKENLEILGVNISFLTMAGALAIFFAILIAYHDKILIVCVMAICLGIVDTYGNYTLISGMARLAVNSTSTDLLQQCAESIWHHYYLGNPQLQRILAYMLIAFCALGLVIFRKKIINKYPESLIINLPKYLIMLAIIFNELTMLNYRIERENALESIGRSYYFQWSPYNPIKPQTITQSTQCPIKV